jgi:hypothetical protein
MKWIFDVFSRRPASSVAPQQALPSTFRNRVFLYCRDLFPNTQLSDDLHRFWADIHVMLQYRHGKPVLSNQSMPASATEDVIGFLQGCSTEYFLDFLEYLFRAESLFRATKSEPEIVKDLNEFFLVDDLPYALTNHVYTERMQQTYLGEHLMKFVECYPQVIRRENQILHVAAIEPTLHFLSDPAFLAADREFLAALEDYRKGDFGDCLVKCGSSFESVLKVVCDQKGWPYNQKDAALSLLRNVLPRTTLDSFFEQPLLLIATIRNRLSTAHGSGTQTKAVPAEIARYAINATAAGILLIIDSTR